MVEEWIKCGVTETIKVKDYIFYTTYNLRYPVHYHFLIYMAHCYFNLDEVYEAYSLCFIAIHFSHKNKQILLMGEIYSFLKMMDAAVGMVRIKEQLQKMESDL